MHCPGQLYPFLTGNSAISLTELDAHHSLGSARGIVFRSAGGMKWYNGGVVERAMRPWLSSYTVVDDTAGDVGPDNTLISRDEWQRPRGPELRGGAQLVFKCLMSVCLALCWIRRVSRAQQRPASQNHSFPSCVNQQRRPKMSLICVLDDSQPQLDSDAGISGVPSRWVYTLNLGV